MKKLFTMLVATVCATMAYAQEVTVKDVTMSAGETPNMEVSISNVNQYTAFQFDLALPTGFSVKNASLSGTTATTRKLEKALYDEATNKWRFLSYDEGNAKMAEGTTVNITLEAADGAEGGDVAGSEILVVTPEAVSTTQETASAKITISGGVSIEIPAGGKLATVLTRDVDFTSLGDEGVKAYIATGYEYESKMLWLTRVNQVPAGTPIVVIGAANSTFVVPSIAKSLTYYKENLLKGSVTSPTTLNWDSYQYFAISRSTGKIANLGPETTSLAATKVCIQVPKDVTSSVKGGDESITIAAGGRLAYVNKYDLDFSSVEGLTAYTVTGFGEKLIWISEVQIASAGTPLLLKGTPNVEYKVPSIVSNKSYYANMLQGSATEAIPVKAVDGGYTTLVLSKKAGQYGELGSDMSIPAGTSYLPVLTSYNVKSATTRGMGSGIIDSESGMIVLPVESDGTTGISRVAAETGNDTWYNLNGQRIDTPTKKGLYIKNGKKVIVK